MDKLNMDAHSHMVSLKLDHSCSEKPVSIVQADIHAIALSPVHV